MIRICLDDNRITLRFVERLWFEQDLCFGRDGVFDYVYLCYVHQGRFYPEVAMSGKSATQIGTKNFLSLNIADA